MRNAGIQTNRPFAEGRKDFAHLIREPRTVSWRRKVRPWHYSLRWYRDWRHCHLRSIGMDEQEDGEDDDDEVVEIGDDDSSRTKTRTTWSNCCCCCCCCYRREKTKIKTKRTMMKQEKSKRTIRETSGIETRSSYHNNYDYYYVDDFETKCGCKMIWRMDGMEGLQIDGWE